MEESRGGEEMSGDGKEMGRENVQEGREMKRDEKTKENKKRKRERREVIAGSKNDIQSEQLRENEPRRRLIKRDLIKIKGKE